MKDFFVPKDSLLFSNSMGMNSDFSVRGFSAGVAEAMTTLTATVSAAVPTDQLWGSTVLCINADDGIVDAKGHPLSIVGGVTLSTELGYPTMLFNGSNGYLTSPDSADWFYESGPLTIEAWVQPLSLTYVMILSQLEAISSNNNRFLVGDYDNKLNFFCSTTTNTIDCGVTATFSTGSMQYYAVKFADGYVSHWLNGVMQGSPMSTSGSVHNISGLLYIGALRYAGAMRYLNGHMRGLRITRADRDVSAVPTYPFPTS